MLREQLQWLVMTARDIIQALGLEPHPERGFYRETYRAPAQVHSPAHGATRAASTAIYFLITAHQLSRIASAVLNAQTNRNGLSGPSQLTSEKLKILMVPASLLKKAVTHSELEHGEECGNGCDHAKYYSEFHSRCIH